MGPMQYFKRCADMDERNTFDLRGKLEKEYLYDNLENEQHDNEALIKKIRERVAYFKEQIDKTEYNK